MSADRPPVQLHDRIRPQCASLRLMPPSVCRWGSLPRGPPLPVSGMKLLGAAQVAGATLTLLVLLVIATRIPVSLPFLFEDFPADPQAYHSPDSDAELGREEMGAPRALRLPRERARPAGSPRPQHGLLLLLLEAPFPRGLGPRPSPKSGQMSLSASGKRGAAGPLAHLPQDARPRCWSDSRVCPEAGHFPHRLSSYMSARAWRYVNGADEPGRYRKRTEPRGDPLVLGWRRG